LRSFHDELRSEPRFRSYPSLGLLSPSESSKPDRFVHVVRSHLSGVSSPSALAELEVRFTRACPTRHLPSSGFLTLLTIYSFQNLPALFHAGNALGVRLFRASPPQQSLHSLSRVAALLAFGSCPPKSASAATFRALLPARIRHLASKCPLTTGRCPPELHAL
jgi:hypothetical protein